MNVLTAALVVLGLVALATVLGLWWKARDGRVRASDGKAVQLADTNLDAWAERATLLQFSTEFCARCPATRRYLNRLAASHEGVLRTEIDLTHNAALANRYGITQTPTVLLLDADGRIRARADGAPRPAEFEHKLTQLLRSLRDEYTI